MFKDQLCVRGMLRNVLSRCNAGFMTKVVDGRFVGDQVW